LEVPRSAKKLKQDRERSRTPLKTYGTHKGKEMSKGSEGGSGDVNNSNNSKGERGERGKSGGSSSGRKRLRKGAVPVDAYEWNDAVLLEDGIEEAGEERDRRDKRGKTREERDRREERQERRGTKGSGFKQVYNCNTLVTLS
jgi:hypothetical protein